MAGIGYLTDSSLFFLARGYQGQISDYDAISTSQRESPSYLEFLYHFGQAVLDVVRVAGSRKEDWERVVRGDVPLSVVLSMSDEAYLILVILNNWRMIMHQNLPIEMDNQKDDLMEKGGQHVEFEKVGERSAERQTGTGAPGPRWSNNANSRTWTDEGYKEYVRVFQMVSQSRKRCPNFEYDAIFRRYCLKMNANNRFKMYKSPSSLPSCVEQKGCQQFNAFDTLDLDWEQHGTTETDPFWASPLPLADYHDFCSNAPVDLEEISQAVFDL